MPSRPAAATAPEIARCAALAAQVAFARKLHTVVDLRAGSGDLLALLGPAFRAWGYDLMPDNIAAAAERGADVRPGWLGTPIEWGQIAVAIGVVEQQPDPVAFVRSAAEHAEVLICSSPLGIWDFAGYRDLFEQGGYQVTQHQAVGSSQVVVAERLGTRRSETPAVPSAPQPRAVPRYAIIPTHNRPELLTELAASLGKQCDGIVVLDNASDPPVDAQALRQAAGIPTEVIRDGEQPPNLARFWNVMFDWIARRAKANDQPEWDVAVLNDDSIVPAGWYAACSNGLRGHETAVITHTSPTTPALLTELHNQPGNRMTPHAFVIRGELGMRADERMKWWYQDSDIDLRARLAGGVLSVPGPTVVNAKANQTTVGFLAGQAQADHAVFAEKWSR